MPPYGIVVPTSKPSSIPVSAAGDQVLRPVPGRTPWSWRVERKPMDDIDARAFLSQLYANAPRDWFIEIGLLQYRPTQEDPDAKRMRTRFFPVSSIFSDWENIERELTYYNQKCVENIHFGVNPRYRSPKRAGKNEDVSHYVALWADVDFNGNEEGVRKQFTDAMEFLKSKGLPPSCIIESGHGHHAYWFLDQIYPVQEARPCCAGIQDVMKIADPIHDPRRLLRLPGFANLKDPKNPVWCRVVEASWARYSLEKFREFAINVPQPPKQQDEGQSKPANTTVSRDPEIERIKTGPVSEGERHLAAVRLVAHHCARAKNRKQVLDATYEWNTSACKPPMDLKELNSIVDDLWAKEECKRLSMSTPDGLLRNVMPTVKVLGERDGEILLYVRDTRRVVTVTNLAALDYAALAQIAGVSIIERVAFPGAKFDPHPRVKRVQAAMGVVARRRQLGNYERLGQGIWLLRSRRSMLLLIVNGDEAVVWNGRRWRQLNAPIIGRHLIEWCAGKRWCDLNRVLEKASSMNHGKGREIIGRLSEIFARWRWRSQEDAALMAGLVAAMAVQAVWVWRPQGWISGQRDSGKSTLMEFLGRLFEPLSLHREGGISEAGLRQEVGHDGRIILIDEFENSRQRDGVLQLLRSAGRGGVVSKGTTTHRPVSFTVRCMGIVSGIEIGLNRAADRSRFLVLELQRPDKRSDPIALSSSEIEELREDLYALTLWCALHARELARRLAQTKVEGVDGRLVEGYAVPVALMAVATGADEQAAAKSLLEYLRVAVLPNQSGEVLEDESALLRDIAFSRLRVLVKTPTADGEDRSEYVEMGVSQILGSDDPALLDQLEAAGVGLVESGGRQVVFVIPSQVCRHLLRGTRWAELSLREILLRVLGAKDGRHRLAKANPQRGVEIPPDALMEQDLDRAAGTAPEGHNAGIASL